MKKLKRKSPIRMRDVLSLKVIETGVDAKNSIEAIQAAAKLLINDDKITQHDADELVKSYRRFGGNIVIDKGIAMPHLLLPELSGPCMSLITLKNPVPFNNEKNDPVLAVMVLLSNNNIAHVGIIEDIIELFNDEERKAAVFNADSKFEIINQIYIDNKEGTDND
jgi:mannitol/fructose-specific phosphotransferase system IIA component (Ntr-type)